jgi:hypothetical protein
LTQPFCLQKLSHSCRRVLVCDICCPTSKTNFNPTGGRAAIPFDLVAIIAFFVRQDDTVATDRGTCGFVLSIPVSALEPLLEPTFITAAIPADRVAIIALF